MEILAMFVAGILAVIVFCAAVAWCLVAYGGLIIRLLDWLRVPRSWGCRALVGFGFLIAPIVVLIVFGHVVGGVR
jgi:hypothetical protein